MQKNRLVYATQPLLPRDESNEDEEFVDVSNETVKK